MPEREVIHALAKLLRDGSGIERDDAPVLHHVLAVNDDVFTAALPPQ